MAKSSLGLYVLNDAGEPVPEPDTLVWSKWLAAATVEGRRHIGDDTVGPYRVSTVFLGLDHSYGEGPPVLWETMIFGMPQKISGKLYRKELFQKRYCSKAGALAGHARAVKYAESLPQPVAVSRIAH